MELGSGDGKPQTTVVQPATEAHVEHGHIPVSTTSISCSNLRAGGRAARAAPSICQHHMPPNVCTGPICDDLHICRLYLDGFCPREDTDCRWGHVIKSAGNCNSLKAYHLQGVPEDDLMWFARSLMRQTASVSLKDYRQELMLCEEYSSGAQCDRDDCFKMHLCPRLVAGHCPSGSQCGWNHRLNAPENLMILLRLKCANLANDEVLARLGRFGEEMHESVGSSSGVESQMTMSPSVTEDPAKLSNSGDETENEEASDEVSCGSPSDDDDLSVIASTPVKSTPDSADPALLSSLDLCLENIHPSMCVNAACAKLHLCRLYVAGMCPYGETCVTGHEAVSSAHNSEVLKHHRLEGISEADLVAGLREGYISRHPIITAERQLALQVCRPCQTGICHRRDCPRLHICMRYVHGKCRNQSRCDLSHDIGEAAHADILGRAGLDSVPMEHLLDILASPVSPGYVQRALSSGVDDVAFAWLSAFLQTERESCALQMSGVSSSLPAGAEHTSIRPPVESKTVVHTPDAAPVAEQNILEAPADVASKTKVKKIGSSLDLCHTYVREGACRGEDCQKLHLCRFFAAGVCPNGNQCVRSHVIGALQHNQYVLKKHGITGADESIILKLLRSGYISRNPLTDAERHWALQVCQPYQTGNCKETKCLRLHVCKKYAQGACSSLCGLSHQISSPAHAAIMRPLGLASMAIRDVRAILQAASRSLPTHPASDANSGEPESPHEPADETSQESCSRSSAIGCSATESNCSGDEVTDSTPANTDGAAESLMLCDVHSSGNRCTRPDCAGFHICGFFLADVCRRPKESCPLGHDFETKHNMRVMQRLQLVSSTSKELKKLLANTVLQARITFRNGAHKRVKLCTEYNSPGGCSGFCKGFHICRDFLAGKCVKSDCRLFHKLCGFYNTRLRATIDLAAVNVMNNPNVNWATDRDLIELLRAKMSLNPGVYPIDNAEPPCPSSISSHECDEETRVAADHKTAPSLPLVCQKYGTVAGCSNLNCPRVHLCPHFLASSCRNRRCRPCTLEHRLVSLHNRELLRQAGWEVTSENHQEIVKMLYDSSPHVRRTEVYEKLRVCTPHSTYACWDLDCTFIHMCQRYIAGSCTRHCTKGHCLGGGSNRKKLIALGLGKASDDEVLEMLRAIHAGPSVSRDAVNLWDAGHVAEDDFYGPWVDDTSPAVDETCISEEPSTEGTEDESSCADSVSSEEVDSGDDAVSGDDVSDEESVADDLSPPVDTACDSEQTSATETQVVSSCADVAESCPAVCRQYSSPTGCTDADCDAVHICPHYLADSCVRSDCSLGHLLITAHNRDAFRRAGQNVNHLDHDATLKLLYKMTPHIPSVALYRKLRLCEEHDTADGCALSNCLKIHLCHEYLAGVCKGKNCEKGHVLKMAELRVDGLGDTSAEEVLEMLCAVHGFRSLSGSCCASASVCSVGGLAVKVNQSTSDGSATEHSALTVCRQYGTIAGCSEPDCNSVHICPHLLANSCRRGIRCQLDHELTTHHNQQVLRRAGIETLTDERRAELMAAMYTNSSHIQRTGVYQQLRVCGGYNNLISGCQNETCRSIHLCAASVAGTCDGPECERDVHSARNRAKLDRIGLGAASSDEVLEMLRAVHAWRSMCTVPVSDTRRSRSPAGRSTAPEPVTDAGRSRSPAGRSTAPEPVTDTGRSRSPADRSTAPEREPSSDRDPVNTIPSETDGGEPSDGSVKLALCRWYGTEAGCEDSECLYVHICPHYVAGACRRADHCELGHWLDDWELNALRQAGHETHDRRALIDTLRRASPHVPSAEVYRKLRVCTHPGSTGCQRPGCTHIHICPHFIRGTCKLTDCRRGHDIETAENRAKLRDIGLGDAASDWVLEMLRAVHAWRTVVY